MSLDYQRKRIGDFLAAVRMARGLAERERWPRERLAQYQRERLEAVVRHAVARSPYYRELIGDARGGVRLEALPTLDKATLMERYDDVVTDPRLRRDELLAHVERVDGDELHLGRYRVLATSGSSGRKGLYVLDRREWSAYVAQFLRYASMTGITPRLPRLRIAALGGTSPSHATRRVAQTIDFGLHRMLSLPVTLPIERLVDELNRFQPGFVNAYPSIAVLLAEEQLAGRLRIAPAGISTSSELRTAAMTRRIEEAFGVRPFDLYGSTEGLWACDCDERGGMHLFEDMTLVENVDDDGRPVPDGELGAKLLVTSLTCFTQPLIRFELADAVTIEPEPCPCGRTLRRLRTIEGRSDDVLRLPDRSGREVAVHRMHFSAVSRDRDVVEFQVVQEGTRLRLLVVPRGAAPALEDRLRRGVEERLRAVGVDGVEVAVERRERLPRQAGGKLQIVVADRSAPPSNVPE